MPYDVKNWPEDKLLVARMVHKGKLPEAREYLMAFHMAQDLPPHIEHFVNGALFMLDVITGRS